VPRQTPSKTKADLAGCRLRPARAAELPILLEHRRLMWVDMGRLGRDAKDPSAKAFHGWMSRHLRKKDILAIVAVEGDRIVASGCVWFQETQPRPHLPQTATPYLLSVYTEPDRRRLGLARRIVEALIAESRRRGYGRVSLHASDEGRPLYDSLGFKASPEMWLDFPR